MTFQSLKKRKQKQNQFLGIWITLPSPEVCEVLGHSGLDFAILDLEHGTFDLPTLGHCVRALQLTGAVPIVRIPEISSTIVQNVLDLGVDGLVVPQVKSNECVNQVFKLMNYAPEGTRGYNPFIRGELYGPNREREKPFLSIIIENKQAFENLPAIAGNPVVDMVYLGVYDMSVHLGCPGEVENQKIKDFVASSISILKEKGKSVGLLVKSPKEYQEWASVGIEFLVYGTDTLLLSTELRALKK